ncbi:MAG: signal peptidase I [Endomicrobia bacterium]|nr:signal peptidase I [Endomicrobiia bacterium]MCX7941443.1 signal peptidase I [Endomicrobiia bacterium]MDW8055453.1 signal peptidase I [Elusimicrobiota bacterium]
MIFFETMSMEAKLIIIGSVFLIWYFLFKILKPKQALQISRTKFVILHSLLGFIIGGLVGLVVSMFRGEIETQTVYFLVTGIIFFFIFLIYAMVIRNNVIPKVLDSDYEWGETGWSTLYIVAVIMYCFIQAFKIPTGSMRMTLLEGDHLFVNKFIYGIKIPFTDKRIFTLKKIKRKDIVVFSCPPVALTTEEQRKKIQKDFIKRCVGLPGDKIEIRDKVLYVNDEPQIEPYAKFEDDKIYQTQQFYKSQHEYQRAWEQGRFTELPPFFIRDNFGPVIVPPGCYFVLGDNRDKSFDSRFWGPLEEKYIKGAPLVVYWPPKRIRIPK